MTTLVVFARVASLLFLPSGFSSRHYRMGRDANSGIVQCAHDMAEIRSRSAASSSPSSGPGQRLRFCCLLRGSAGLGISQPCRGCRIFCRYPSVCAWVRGSSGPGAWHPLAPTWVPRPGCRAPLCVLSLGVLTRDLTY